MTNAIKDANGVAGMIALLETTGASIIRLTIDPSTHALSIDDDTTGSDHGPAVAVKDENSVATLCAVSEVDGKTLVPLYATSDGKLLIDSN